MASALAKTIALATAVQATTYKIGVLTDMHLQVDYLPDRSPSQYCCKQNDPTKEDKIMADIAHFGRWKCDVPQSMVDAAMAKMRAENPDLAFILVPGDIVGHGIDLDIVKDHDLDDVQIKERYNKTMAVH